MWRRALDTMRVIIDPPESRDRVLEKPLPLLGAASTIHLDYAARKLSVLRRKGVREHPHRLHGNNRQSQGGLSRKRIGYARGIDQGIRLVRPASLYADLAIQAARDPRQ